MNAQIAQLQQGEPEPARALTTTPSQMLAYAMSKDVDIEKLQALYALQQQWERDEARRAYHQALAAFKAEPLTVSKDKLVSIKHKDGAGKTEYRHATLGNVVATIAPALGRHQLSHSWGVRREGDRVYVTCRLTHALGHSEEITLDGPLDASGSKNNIQSVGSTITYLERYTLLAITGIATEDQDDDDGGHGVEYITDKEAAGLRDILIEAGADIGQFLEFMRVDRIEAIPAVGYNLALHTANSKLRKAQQGRSS